MISSKDICSIIQYQYEDKRIINYLRKIYLPSRYEEEIGIMTKKLAINASKVQNKRHKHTKKQLKNIKT